MTDNEYLELLTLSAVLLPNMEGAEFDLGSAARRYMELFEKASKQYRWGQETD